MWVDATIAFEFEGQFSRTRKVQIGILFFLYLFGPQSIDLSNEITFMFTYLHLTSVIDK